jgi:chaperonin cofactor prefoldin
MTTVTYGQAGQNAQQPKTIQAKPWPDTGSIQEQFNYMAEKSNTYQDYRVIKEAWIYKFRNRLKDTLQNLRSQIKSNRSINSNKTNQIDSLQSLLQSSNAKLDSTLKEKNSLNFLGIMLSKQLYDVIMWSIIIILITGLVLVFILYKRGYIVNEQVKKDLDDTRHEFDEFRKKALKSKEDAVRSIYEELKKYKK